MQLLISIYRTIFARPIFFRLNDMLFRLVLRSLGILNYENPKISGEDYLINTILPAKLKNLDPIIFDVGANIGDYSKALADQFPNSSIYSFEPHPKTFSILRSNISNKNVKLFNFALGEKKDTLTLYDRADSNGSPFASLHKEAITDILNQETIEISVPVSTLDEFALENKISYIDFLKIDTEGNELSILKGAKKLLEECKIGCIHFEFNEMNIVSRTFMRDFRIILKNYQLFRLLPKCLMPLKEYPLASELFGFQNIFAIPKNVSSVDKK